MQNIIAVFLDLLPTLILSATAIYIFHEAVRYLKERQKVGAQIAMAQKKAVVDSKPVNEGIIKLQLQAAERFALYLERISPDRLVMRLHQNGMSAKMLQSEMLRSIREEYDHNLSQQIYVSDGAWELVRNAREEMVKFITATGESMREASTGIDLSKKIFQTASRVENMPNDIALKYIRKEIQLLLKGH